METTVILNNLQEAIVIKSDHKIEYINSNFIELFNKPVTKALQ